MKLFWGGLKLKVVICVLLKTISDIQDLLKEMLFLARLHLTETESYISTGMESWQGLKKSECSSLRLPNINLTPVQSGWIYI